VGTGRPSGCVGEDERGSSDSATGRGAVLLNCSADVAVVARGSACTGIPKWVPGDVTPLMGNATWLCVAGLYQVRMTLFLPRALLRALQRCTTSADMRSSQLLVSVSMALTSGGPSSPSATALPCPGTTL
jgi:hypothetical protein